MSTTTTFQATTVIEARKVLRSEGEVWRYWFTDVSDGYEHRGEKESAAYTYLRDVLGASSGQAAAVIVAAQADFSARFNVEFG
jgi:hypothetical protein